MRLTLGWSHASKMGVPQVVEYRPGTPIAIEGVELQLTISAEGAIAIRGTGVTTPVLRPISGNAVAVTAELMQDWHAQ